MTERIQLSPNIQVLSFNSPNRFGISQRSPSIKSDSPQIIALGAGRRQVVNPPQEHKLNSITNILKMMHEWTPGTQTINTTEWIDAELRKYLLQIDKRFQRLFLLQKQLFLLQKSLQRAFNFNDIVEQGTFHNVSILGITEMTNQRKIFGFACEDHQKFLNSIANAQMSELGLHLSHRINQQHLQSLNLISINKRMREDLMRLKQQNSSDYRFRSMSYEAEINNLRIQQTYEMIKQELSKSSKNISETSNNLTLEIQEKNRKVKTLEKQKGELQQTIRLLQEQASKSKRQANLSDNLLSYNQKTTVNWQQLSLKAQDKARTLQRQNKQLKDKLSLTINQNTDKQKAQSMRLQQLQLLSLTQSRQIQTLKRQVERERQNSYNNSLNRKLDSSQLQLLTNKCQQLAISQKEKQQQLSKLKKYCLSLQGKLKDSQLLMNRQQNLQQVRVKQLQQQNRSLKANFLKYSQLIIKNQQNQIKITELLKQIDYLKGSVKRQVQQKLKAQQLYKTIQSDQSLLKQQLFMLRRTIAQKQQTINDLQKSIRALQQSMKNKNSSQSQTRILQIRIKQVQQQRNKRTYELNQQRTQKAKLQQKAAKQKAQIQDLNEQIQQLNRILDEKNESSMLRQQTQQQHQLVRGSDKQTSMSLKIAQLQGSISMKSEQLIQLQQRIRDKDDQLSRLYQQSMLKDQRTQKLTKQLNELTKTANSTKLQHQQTLSKLTLQKSQLQAKLAKISSQFQIAKRDPNDVNHVNALFQHEVLYNRFEYKEYLINIIEKQMRMEIAKTKLLFAFDPLNRTNFHQYIDEKSNIVIIIKLENGYYVAAYTEGYFKPKHVSKDFGLLVSLTNRKYFTLADSSKRSIYYDEYFIIFGNSQIRLKSQQNILFSNFGINNSSFNSRGEKVNVLLGQGNNRQVPIETYEIYQVTFNN